MATFITPFDPSATTSGKFVADLPNGGWLFIHNESPVELSLQVGILNSGVIVPAYTARCFKAALRTSSVSWQQLGVVQSPGQAPISQVYGEAYEPQEWTGGEMYVALARQVNVGNTVSTNATPAIVNDGNAPATSIVEATPSDQAASSVSLHNDATGFLQVLSAGVLRKILNVVRGNSGTGKAQIIVGDAGDPTILLIYQAELQSDNGNLTSDGAGNVNMNNVPSSGQRGITFSGSAQDTIEWLRDTQRSRAFVVTDITSGVDLLKVSTGGALTVAAGINTDAGLLSSDGLGDLTAVKLIAAPSGVGNNTPTLLDLKPTGATVTKEWIILYNGATGGIQFYNLTDNINAFSITPAGGLSASQSMSVGSALAVTGNISSNGGHNVPYIVPTGTSTAGRQLFTGTTAPTGANEGDIWINA